MNPEKMHLVPIVMADDDEDDQLLTKDALEEGRLFNPLFFVDDGQELIEFLRNEGNYQDKKKYPRPGLILLDLNMPRMSGLDALEIIKTDPSLKTIPIIILTTSQQESEVAQTYARGANSFVVKPVRFEDMVSILKAIGEYWFSIVKLP